MRNTSLAFYPLLAALAGLAACGDDADCPRGQRLDRDLGYCILADGGEMDTDAGEMRTDGGDAPDGGTESGLPQPDSGNSDSGAIDASSPDACIESSWYADSDGDGF